MRNKLIALVTVIGVSLATVAPSKAWWSPYGGGVGFYGGLGMAGALVGGLAAGAIIAGSRPYGYGGGYYNNGYNYYGYYGAPAPGYYAPAPTYYYYGY
jgi:hypothetical protein